MNKEQNIDDILKLLKDSVLEQATSIDFDEVKHDGEDMSAEILQKQLKSQYIDKPVSDSAEQARSEYILDDDFLTDATDGEDTPEAEQEPVAEEEIPAEVEELVEAEEVVETEEVEELVEVEKTEELVEVEAVEELVEAEELEEVEAEAYAEELAEEVSEEVDGEQETEEIPAEEEIPAPVEKAEPHETFLASMRKTGMDFTTDDMFNASANRAEVAPEISTAEDDLSYMEDATEEEIVGEDESIEVDSSTVNLMLQFCEKDELEETIGDKNVDDFLKSEQAVVTEDEPDNKADYTREYTETEQNEEIIKSYKKQLRVKLLSFLGCTALAVLTLVYELLPIFGTVLSGILDYTEYPAIYALVGLQLAIFATAIRYKAYWAGLKKAFSSSPTLDSVVSVTVTATAVYDIVVFIILAINGDALPSMYNGIAVLLITVSAFADYMKTLCTIKVFGVYSSYEPKYTLVKEKPNGSIGMKMYGGGLEADRSIYSVGAVDFPNGFFRSIKTKFPKNKMLVYILMPVLVLGMAAAVVSVITGDDVYTVGSAFSLCLFLLMPTLLIVCDFLPYSLACLKLAKRGSAFAGPCALEGYKDIDIMVFTDLHMFKKCKTEDVGIAMYDSKIGYLTLGCLDALYSKIGGPLSGMKIDLPDVFKFDSVSIKRVARNGVEAIVDRKHALIVGDHAFMQRYGLSFPQNETDNGRSTLCVSLNGKVTAKLSVLYETEPVFEMLVERLASENISCAIQTLDPLINSALVARSRTVGDTPISVIHGNASDIAVNQRKRYNADADGVICCSSRLKLAEAAVWSKKVSALKGVCEKISLAFCSIGAFILIVALSFGIVSQLNQLYVLLFYILQALSVWLVCLLSLPSKRYFTVDSLYSELERAHTRQIAAEEKKQHKFEEKQQKMSEEGIEKNTDE